ncbi:hypothetical protein FisN_3Lh013 [Fistulifera solaris]|uniref:RING-type domain-containing protein n=1 Tax=Fistulifera solaris TaxID=1519565 RepID=A0A1Z5JYT9_FISSO|nr:hypothetical protein FisN_3Lh013 [Fistulifera solaris]|eukprot:GAX19079.1 hypothetical protein FisN_3Lh013 [Fistulifera solaris]
MNVMWFQNGRSRKAKESSQGKGLKKHNRHNNTTTRKGPFELLDDDTVGAGSVFTSPDAVTCTGHSEANTRASGRNLLDVTDIEDQLRTYKQNVRLGIGNSPNEKTSPSSASQKRNRVIPLRSPDADDSTNINVEQTNMPTEHKNRSYSRFEPVCDSPKKNQQPLRDVYASIKDSPVPSKASSMSRSAQFSDPSHNEPVKPFTTSSKSLPSILRPRTASEDSNNNKRGSNSSKLRFGADVKSPKAPFVLPEHVTSPKARDNSSYCSEGSEFSPLVGLKLLGAEEDDTVTTMSESLQPKGVQDAELVNGPVRGVMRLTEDGLKAHERKTFREPKKTTDKLLVIKQEQAERQWYRHQRRQVESGAKPGFSSRMFQAAQIKAVPAEQKTTSDSATNSKHRGSFLDIFKQSKSDAAEKVLQEEVSDSAMQKKMQQKELEEFQRIEKKRQEYLARQRALEQRPPGLIEKKSKEAAHNDIAHDMSTMSSTKSGALPPCVVCGLGTRSHIAAPCMHYAFCEACVAEGLGETCPVCATKNVKFVPVAV